MLHIVIVVKLLCIRSNMQHSNTNGDSNDNDNDSIYVIIATIKILYYVINIQICY